MNQMTPEFAEKARKAFTDHAGITLQDVRRSVAALPATTRRRDTLSALDAVLKLYGKPLADVPANWISLRNLFVSRNAAQRGVSAKRIANIRSEVTKAVRTFGAGRPTLTKRIALSPQWDRLLSSIPLKHYRYALNRLAGFCSAMGISPDHVNAEALLAFHEALVAEEVIKDPRKILKFTISHWNMCRSRVSQWPNYKLSSPFPSSQYALELSSFPISFQADVKKWRQRLLEAHVLDNEGPDVPLRPITVDSQEKKLLRFATALVLREHKRVDEIRSLSVLVEIGSFKEGLLYFLNRAGDKKTAYIRKIAWLLYSVARHHVKVSAETLKDHKTYLRRLGQTRIGMTEKNRKRLKQFDEHESIRKLLCFPEEERARGLKINNPYRRAKAFERALAAAILIYISPRMQNLRTIRIDKNIRESRGACILSFDEDETKNKRSFEGELPDEVSELLNEYLKDHRKFLPGSNGPYLFPGREGGPRSANTMSHDFKTAVLKHTGLIVNAHFMRHLTATLAIEQDPANLTIVAQRLGHRTDTTQKYYLNNESRSSSRVMNTILEEAKKKQIKQKRPRK